MLSKKTFTTFSILVTLLLFVSFASAAIDFYPSTLSDTVEQGKTFEVKFNMYNDYTSDLTNITYSTENLKSGSNTLSVTQTLTNLPSSISNKTNSSDVTYKVSIPSDQEPGTYTGNLTIIGDYTTTRNYNLPISIKVTEKEEKSLCEFGEVGDLEIVDLEIDNNGKGDDEEWELLDEIIIRVEVENTNETEDVDDVMVELIIKDSSNNDVTNDFDLEDEEEDLGRIKDEDSEIAEFIIPEIPADIDDGDYYLYFLVYSDGEEEKHCTSVSEEFDDDYYQKIEITREDDEAVIVKEPSIEDKVLASCGDKNVKVTFDVYNIGDDEEESVLVNLFNSELGISEFQVIDDLRSGKKEEVTFFINIPENLDEKRYDLEVVTYYDYDDDEDENEMTSYDLNSKDDLDDDYYIPFEIISCTAPEPSILAELISETTKQGEEFVVKATITNKGSEGDYIISATGFDDWAELVSTEPQRATLENGQSVEVMITLLPKESGFKTFNINAITGGDVYSRPVSVNIEGKPEKTNIIEGLRDEVLYLVAGIVALLIIILIILIIRLATRKRPREQF